MVNMVGRMVVGEGGENVCNYGSRGGSVETTLLKLLVIALFVPTTKPSPVWKRVDKVKWK